MINKNNKVSPIVSATVLAFIFVVAIIAIVSVFGGKEEAPTMAPPTATQLETVPESQPVAPETQSQPPTKVVFDLRAVASKISYTNIKSMLGSPTREGVPDPLLDLDGWAEWDKDGLTLAIQYGRTGILKNNKVAGCAISLFPKKGFLSEDQLRQAGNLPKGNSFIVEDRQVGILLTFTIKPAYNIYNKLYAIEVCP